ncbi:hypothetical protein G3N57_12145 [Paraburkholderia sp. Se-20369]|nr:hypothetical protein [Paraburkholderia sp. Se-20369]
MQVRTPDEIVLAPMWEHRVDDTGVCTHVRMHDHGTLGEPAVIFNRIVQLEGFPLQRSVTEDRDYAHAEMAALLLSWLAGVQCPVINRPSPVGLAGSVNRPLVWQKLAQKAGLRTTHAFVTTSTRRFPAPLRLKCVPQPGPQAVHASQFVRLNQFGWFADSTDTSSDSVFVVGGRVIGNVSPSILAGALRLATMSGLDVLELHFSKNTDASDSPSFVGADACPVSTDPMIVAAIADLLKAKAGNQSTLTN